MNIKHKSQFGFFLGNIAILNPKGIIAAEQKNLIITAVLLMLIMVIPILITTFVFAWKYRASRKADYAPNFDRSLPLQFTYGVTISCIIAMLAFLAWHGAHALDPRRPIVSTTKPITIQVVALEWKWLFIYQEQNIATTNLVQFPEDTPINFEITADAPMNSFWIPQLGGQMYAMSGMKTQLHLMANETGDFSGRSSNISGEGFAGMTFIARSTSKKDFDAWVQTVKYSGDPLNSARYEQLALPSQNNPQVLYALAEPNLFDSIIMKFMPASSMDESMPDMHH